MDFPDERTVIFKRVEELTGVKIFLDDDDLEEEWEEEETPCSRGEAGWAGMDLAGSWPAQAWLRKAEHRDSLRK